MRRKIEGSASIKKFLIFLLCCFITLPTLGGNTILIIGDSLSTGYGFDANRSWITLLQNRLKDKNYDYEVINASISGDTTGNGLARLPLLLKQYLPIITIIELGGNDGLRGIQLPVIKNNLARIIALTQEANSKVLLLGIRLPPNYGQQYTEQFLQLYSELVNRYGIAFVPNFLVNVDESNQLMQKDRIHPTGEAQVIILDNIWPELEKLLTR
ncbi:MAG: hypothetical protein A3E83_06445 [Gammaproteobacteria bacterium RIFCSPHIGHO2_12_FULL_41_20]|nr:MAG: hypothetical protein A3E83_06445 [Gammaproteobacteria bacterium RIFCSPHIGHO2_12_FULL_41_20]